MTSRASDLNRLALGSPGAALAPLDPKRAPTICKTELGYSLGYFRNRDFEPSYRLAGLER